MGIGLKGGDGNQHQRRGWGISIRGEHGESRLSEVSSTKVTCTIIYLRTPRVCFCFGFIETFSITLIRQTLRFAWIFVYCHFIIINQSIYFCTYVRSQQSSSLSSSSSLSFHIIHPTSPKWNYGWKSSTVGGLTKVAIKTKPLPLPSPLPMPLTVACDFSVNAIDFFHFSFLIFMISINYDFT